MQINLHQTHHTVADFDAIYEDFTALFKNPKTRGLHIFSELFLTGYPLQDLCLQKTFIDRYKNHLERLEKWAANWKAENDVCALVGGLSYEFDDQGLPKKIQNVIYSLSPGKKLKIVYAKILLPNYDIFDEEKYFHPGEKPGLFEFAKKTFGLLVCEDMWSSSLHPQDPVVELAQISREQKQQLDGVINLSASPYFLGKHKKRLERAEEISHIFGAPFIYVNRVGGEDEILFDGQSFVMNAGSKLNTCKAFDKDTQTLELPSGQGKMLPAKSTPRTKNTWEDLFNASLSSTERPATLCSLSEDDCQELTRALCFGLQEYARKSGFRKFSVALSGGIDSALVLALVSLSLKDEQELEAIYMPGLFSAPMSHDLSREMCQKTGIRMRTLPIKFLHSTVRNTYRDSMSQEMEGIADENIQSRLRGSLLYARSNQWGSMVINTSNKSEIAVGYSTQYGDSVGAISLLGDLYKTEVFQLANYLNRKHDNIIPQGIIDRPPTAELRENQEDSQSLPPYQRLDAILEGLLSYRLGIQDLIDLGLPEKEIEKTYDLYQKSEYKRRQFCPIIKVKQKSFGFGYRVPLTKVF
jgi:NAD+ synthase (glutamine-hydrolysing)